MKIEEKPQEKPHEKQAGKPKDGKLRGHSPIETSVVRDPDPDPKPPPPSNH